MSISAPQSSSAPSADFHSVGSDATVHVSGARALHDKQFWILWLEHAIYLSLLVLVVAEPFSTATVLFVFRIALALWVVKLTLTGFKVHRGPLAIPLLLFFIATGISTVFSYAPLLSWSRMAWYSVALICFLVTENVKSIAELKWLVVALLIATSVSALETGWQFTAGIGTELLTVTGPTRQAGLQAGDIVREINGHSVRRIWLWQRALRLTEHDSVLRMHVARPFPGGLEQVYVVVPRAALEEWLRGPGQLVVVGYPPRAQGHFYHAIPYAGMLTQVVALCWGLLLASRCAKLGKRALLALVFGGLAASLWATVTRAYLLAVLVGCLTVLWITARWKVRVIAAMATIILVAGGSFWIQSRRHVSWFSSAEPGTEYRMMMWANSPRLIRQHPFLGIGLDSVRLAGNRFNISAYKVFPLKSGHFHSTYIELAVDCGLPALGLWLWLMVEYFRHLRRLLLASTHAGWFAHGMALGIFASAIAFYLGCLVQYTLGDGEVMPLVWLFMGCSVVLYRILTESTAPEQTDSRTPVRRATIC
ncbi:MAG TPA: O-antigen ligase family protein [Terriglobales bacterium]|nr:O-antigen ligase family protein [Terriglobales bacterium]